MKISKLLSKACLSIFIILISFSSSIVSAEEELVDIWKLEKKIDNEDLQGKEFNDNSNIEKATKVYEKLKSKGIDVLFDDINENISNKFKKHDLLGIPYQIIIGSKATQDQLEFKEIDKDSQMLDLNKIINILNN